MTNTLQITFTGGFHAYSEATVRATVRDNRAYLSANQARRLYRVFCGMAHTQSKCLCGGVYRATASVPTPWQYTSEGEIEGGLIAYRD